MAYDPPSTIDPDGRRVVFDAGSHLHLAAKRPWLLDEIDTILDTVANPDLHVLDPEGDRERYYHENPFPDGWLRVVVDYSEELELMGVRGMLDRNEELQLTWPPAHLAASALRQALAA